MKQTQNLGLKLPEGSDWADVTALNENMEALDAAVAKKADLGEGDKIPASQLPEMNYDPAGSAAAVQANLEAHIGNKSNPHGMTLAQIGAAAASHNHAASQITSGTLPVARGGTGLTASPSLLVNLASTTAANILASSPRPGVTGILPAARGGTGVGSIAELAALLQANGVPNIYFGSYVGTGNSGPSNPNAITLPFAPRFIHVLNFAQVGYALNCDDTPDASATVMFASQLTTAPQQGYGMGYGMSRARTYGYKSADGKTFYWYCTKYETLDPPGGETQLNKSGYTYFFIAVQ